MTLRSVKKTAVLVAGLASLVGVAGCSRDHIEAINLANEGDRQVKVNVEGAIQTYEQASQRDPSNHEILHKLANAYEKKEDWDKMAATLSRAIQIAPTYASYRFKRGYALIKQAEAGNPDAYQEAKEPLKKCIEIDPNLAECYHFLGEAQFWTDEIQDALSNFTKAIEHDRMMAYFFPPLAETYLMLRMYPEAEQVLEAGVAIAPTEKTQNSLYAMYTLLFEVAQAKDDKAAMVTALERAKEVAGDSHPEISFNLGSTYAIMDPPRKEQAARLLNQFTNRACKGSAAMKFKEQCEAAQSLIQQLGTATP